MKLYHLLLLALAVVLGMAIATPVAAQAKPAEKASSLTQEQGDAILKELRQIRQLLEKMVKTDSQRAEQPTPSAEGVKVQIEGSPTLGSPSAPLTMVEFTDYQCFFCRQFYLNSFAELKKNYIDTGKMRFYSRDLPLDFHANAMRAAEAARCAIEQGKFWQLRDIMGADPDKLEIANLVEDASGLKMNVAAFRSCVESEKYKTSIQTDVMEAMKIGATGTPTFVVGKSTADGVDGEVVLGALPYSAFEEKLKEIK